MTLIIYFGNLGTTKKAAEQLSTYFQQVDVIDGRSKNVIDYSIYDQIIVGTNIRMGKPNKFFFKWMKKHSSLTTDVFIICADIHQKNTYMSKIKETYGNVRRITCFGGELDPNQAKGLSKKVILSCIQEFKKRGLELPSLRLDWMEEFAQSIIDD